MACRIDTMYARRMADGPTLSIDRERFLALVLAMAAQGCGTTPAGDAPVNAPNGPAMQVAAGDAPIVVVPPEETASAAPPESAPPPPPTATAEAPPSSEKACEALNDTGDADCSWMAHRKLSGPMCEGMAGTCESMQDGSIYRRHAGAVAAACFEKLGSRICDIHARQKCYEAGIKASCPEPKYEARCLAQMQKCQAAGRPVKYTLEECVKVASSLQGRERDWAISAMGPSGEGVCKLMFTMY